MAPPGRSRYGNCGGWGYQNDGLGDPARAIGLLHVGARYLDPAIGRFVQRDPIGVGGGLNVYGYCSADPVHHVDPDGRTELSLTGQSVAAGIRAAMHGGVRGVLQVGDDVLGVVKSAQFSGNFIRIGTESGKVLVGPGEAIYTVRCMGNVWKIIP